MKNRILWIIIILVTSFLFSSIGRCGGLDDWEFRFFGVDPRDFNGRKLLPCIAGAIVSIGTHETGHLIVSEVLGYDSEMVLENYRPVAIYYWDDEIPSDDERAIIAASGFIFQTFFGGVLTAIPATRHSDFTVGFNSMSTMTGVSYTITGGFNKDTSDVVNIDKYWHNGTGRIVSGTSMITNGIFTYISLDKHKEKD